MRSFLFRVLKAATRILSGWSQLDESTQSKLVLVVAKSNIGWILDATAREIAAASCHEIKVHYGVRNIPKCPRVMFMHYSLVSKALVLNPWLWKVDLSVFFTHFDREKDTLDKLLDNLSTATKIVCLNSQATEFLRSLRITAKIQHFVGAASSSMFEPAYRDKDGFVLVCTSYYERKNPNLLLEIIKKLQHRQFLILGKNWRRYDKFNQLEQIKNVTFADLPYEQYSNIYKKCAVFLSTSTLEGGPIPLIETMMSNIIPVVSKTGFCPDVVEHGRNGYLFEVNASADHIASLIETALENGADVSQGTEKYDWQAYSDQVVQFLVL